MARTRRPSPQTAAVLVALIDEPSQWHHGYGLSKLTGLASGTLYPILMRLQGRGYVESKWDEGIPGRPPRHCYRLTGTGAAYARESVAKVAATAPHRVVPAT